MKLFSLAPRRLVIDCVALVLLHAALLEVMAHTRVMEKAMAMQFGFWELAAILAFIGVRLAVYFLIPSILVTLLAWEIMRRINTRGGQ
jgi:hypothetical protein